MALHLPTLGTGSRGAQGIAADHDGQAARRRAAQTNERVEDGDHTGELREGPSLPGGGLPSEAISRWAFWRQVWQSMACSRAAWARRTRRHGSSISRAMAAASAAGSSGGMSSAVAPSLSTSAICPTALATIGRPVAMYSKSLV